MAGRVRGFVFRKLIELILKEALAPIANKPLEDAVADLDRDVATGGRFSQADAFYSPLAPPPVFWEYRCKRCRQFSPPSSCRWVEGKISRDGFCALWTPPRDFEKPFSWIRRASHFPEIVVRSARGLIGR